MIAPFLAGCGIGLVLIAVFVFAIDQLFQGIK